MTNKNKESKLDKDVRLMIDDKPIKKGSKTGVAHDPVKRYKNLALLIKSLRY